ncbi:MAG: hypothetical protein FWC26_00265 [Fibromonadales bacterium]|nr:hypothetical protein [Fibromonadales bacterium]
MKLDDKLKAKLLFEISQINKLINDSQPLLNLCNQKVPDYIEMSAAALLLHSFYNGIENVLILIFKSYNEEVADEAKWHMGLLSKAFVSNANRKQIFKNELQESLEEYLKFRHFIRHAYGFQLEWPVMEELVKKIENVWSNIKEDLNNFVS